MNSSDRQQLTEIEQRILQRVRAAEHQLSQQLADAQGRLLTLEGIVEQQLAQQRLDLEQRANLVKHVLWSGRIIEKLLTAKESLLAAVGRAAYPQVVRADVGAAIVKPLSATLGPISLPPAAAPDDEFDADIQRFRAECSRLDASSGSAAL